MYIPGSNRPTGKFEKRKNIQLWRRFFSSKLAYFVLPDRIIERHNSQSSMGLRGRVVLFLLVPRGIMYQIPVRVPEETVCSLQRLRVTCAPVRFPSASPSAAAPVDADADAAGWSAARRYSYDTFGMSGCSSFTTTSQKNVGKKSVPAAAWLMSWRRGSKVSEPPPLLCVFTFLLFLFSGPPVRRLPLLSARVASVMGGGWGVIAINMNSITAEDRPQRHSIWSPLSTRSMVRAINSQQQSEVSATEYQVPDTYKPGIICNDVCVGIYYNLMVCLCIAVMSEAWGVARNPLWTNKGKIDDKKWLT